jgi:hypothetical protein
MKLEEKALLCMPAKTQKLRQKDPKHKKEKRKNKEKKKSIPMKNQDPPPGKTHKLMGNFLNLEMSLSQLLLWLKVPYMQRGRCLNSLSKRYLC